jgi:mannose-6-phosphate isomerase-like protein (cupin superfamily)
MSVVSKDACIEHYQWGNNFDGRILAYTENLSVKQERMPPQTAETLHYHKNAQQFFFILKGTANFEVEEKTFTVKAGEGFHITAGEKHRILNNTDEELEFVLSSQPSVNKDRFNCV